MEALRDRTIRIDIPYITKLHEEIKIYKKDSGPAKVKGKHVAPHTLEVGAMWAVLTRRRAQPGACRRRRLAQEACHGGEEM